MESNSGMANNNVTPTPAAPVKKKNTSLKLGKILMIVGGCGIALYILIVLGFYAVYYANYGFGNSSAGQGFGFGAMLWIILLLPIPLIGLTVLIVGIVLYLSGRSEAKRLGQ